MFSAMRFEETSLYLINQLELPNKEQWLRCQNLEAVAKAIEDMVVRGAPAIGCAAAFGLAIDAQNHTQLSCWSDYRNIFAASVERMARTRPTAVNLFYAIEAMKKTAESITQQTPMSLAAKTLTIAAQNLFDDDIRTCKAIGDHGRTLVSKPVQILTHCNTGSLATAGYGTALGIIRSIHNAGLVKNIWVDETRPYLQGSRLTAFELGQDQIPYKLITDNMAAALMRQGQVDMVVIGADRIAANGDTANKIGSYSLAVLCKYHNISFVVAAPKATIDTKIKTGAEIHVEERPERELKEIHGISLSPKDAKVWNPSFDITPSDLIHAIVTEDGVFKGPKYSFNFANS